MLLQPFCFGHNFEGKNEKKSADDKKHAKFNQTCKKYHLAAMHHDTKRMSRDM